jgi:Zn-dependent protease
MSLEHPPLAPPPERPPMQSPVKERPHPLKRLGGMLVGAALLLWKLAAPLLLVLKNAKFFWAGLTFFVSVAAYTTIWSWRFALGFTVLILIHEMGHVIQLRREGVPATAPLFIPFLGAVVGMKGLPRNAWVEAKVGLAGPVLGTVGAGACLGLAVAVDSDLLRALAYTGFLLNLFNLIPVLPLDGGRAAAAVHPAFWFVGLFAVALLFFMHGSTILLLIAVLGGYELWHRWRRRNDEEFKAYHDVSRNQRIAVGAVYLALIVVLVAGMDASYIHRTL